jgi:arylsulfatase A-like enzyme
MAEADRLLKEFSVAKIKDLAKSDQPFFLEHCFMKAHADNFASREFEGKSGGKYPYKDAVVEVDAYIGEIVHALENAGVLENTFIFITSDNGPQMDSLEELGLRDNTIVLYIWGDNGSSAEGQKGTASETFDVGVDLGSPVSLEYFDRRPFAFNGKIRVVNVELK